MGDEEETRLAQEALDVMKLTSPGRAAVLGLWRSAPLKRQRKKAGNPSAI
jgi:hypothetical protein